MSCFSPYCSIVAKAPAGPRPHERIWAALSVARNVLLPRSAGTKCDLIVRLHATDHQIALEHSAGERGRVFGGHHGTKLLTESYLKLPKTLKNMLDDLVINSDIGQDDVYNMETVGYVTAGKASSSSKRI